MSISETDQGGAAYPDVYLTYLGTALILGPTSHIGTRLVEITERVTSSFPCSNQLEHLHFIFGHLTSGCDLQSPVPVATLRSSCYTRKHAMSNGLAHMTKITTRSSFGQ